MFHVFLGNTPVLFKEFFYIAVTDQGIFDNHFFVGLDFLKQGVVCGREICFSLLLSRISYALWPSMHCNNAILS